MRNLLALAFLAAASLSAFADKIFLKDGRVIEGTILSQSETEVKIDIGKHGAALTFEMEQVEKIDRSAGSPEQLYEGRLLLTDRKNPDALVELADWCAKNGLTKKAGQHYIEALGLQADHPRARGRLTEMGYREVDGKWLSPDELVKLANPPPPPPKPEPKVPTSEDVAREQAASVVVAWGKGGVGIGVWATAEGQVWVSGKAALATQEIEVDCDGKKLPARLVVRDRIRQVALWKIDGVHAKAARLAFEPLPEKDPLVALTPAGVIGNVFARGWDKPMSEVWTVRLEGVQTGAAIFDLKGQLVGLSGDGKTAIGAIDLARLQRIAAPAPEGEQNAAGSYWRAMDLPDGPALEMIRSGAKLDSFEPGLGTDEMNRAAAFARELARLGRKLDGSLDDHIAALRLARHLARAGRVEFTLAAAEILESQGKSLFADLPRLSPAQIERLRAVIEGLGSDPVGLEAAATGEADRLEKIAIGAKEARAILDLQMAGYPILGPEPVDSLDAGMDKMYKLVHACQGFATQIRGALGRPPLARRTELDGIPLGPGPFIDFARVREGALASMTIQAALRIAIRLREMRASSGAYPEEGPTTGMDDPAAGKPFEYKREGRGFSLTAPGGEVFRVKE